jgi:hypothetical protein
MIVALAGRRIDKADSKDPRFPLKNVECVARSLHGLLVEHGTTAIVSSAACGADLIALTEAGKLGLRRKVILPFDRATFRQGSVVDRPGEWGSAYDTVIDEVDAAGDLMTLSHVGNLDPYSMTSERILDEAVELARQLEARAGAIIMWDGAVRDKPDYTADFGVSARRRGLPVLEIRTV